MSKISNLMQVIASDKQDIGNAEKIPTRRIDIKSMFSREIKYCEDPINIFTQTLARNKNTLESRPPLAPT